MLDYHTHPVPTACDVCAYVVAHGLDCAYEHARVRLATEWLLEDLEDLESETAALLGLAVSHVGIEPGPVHPMDPRHWVWAMLHEGRIRVSLRRDP